MNSDPDDHHVDQILAADAGQLTAEAIAGPRPPAERHDLPPEATTHAAREAISTRYFDAPPRVPKPRALATLLPNPPTAGHSLHLVSSGRFDSWDLAVHALGWLQADGAPADLALSTWTMGRDQIADLFRLQDAGPIARADVICGIYFRRREPASFALLQDGLAKRRGRTIAANVHAKVTLLRAPVPGRIGRHRHVVIEGSANCTGNPCLEQFTITTDPDLWNFHRSWMAKVLG